MSDAPKILIVEDQPSERQALARVLRLEGFRVMTAGGVPEARGQMEQEPDLVISDLRLGDETGMDLLRQVRSAGSSLPFILVTAFGEIETAVQAMKLGAADFLTKPLNPTELILQVRSLLADSRSVGESQILRNDNEWGGMLGQSPAMKRAFERAYRAARTDSLVLILGESGTGKELIARAIHQHSRRNEGPFVAVNMAAIPDTLVESELFGHVAGSFTGATGDRMGRIAAADKGTLFVDEIGDFGQSVQAKLLRFLETLSIMPVGSNHEQAVDVRIVAATSRNLRQMVATGTFREDLYYRLNVVTLQLPPLRERAGDAPLLLNHFLHRTCLTANRPVPPLAADLQQFLESYSWPGNVRELRNAIESMVVMGGDTLCIADLPPDLQHAATQVAAPPIAPLDASAATLEHLERQAVVQALERFHGNRTRAAEMLGISVRTLQRKLKQWGLAAGEEV